MSLSRIAIVGGGVFGMATSLEAKTKYPEATVTLIIEYDPCTAPASEDISKIIRVQYKEPFYAKLAEEASDYWWEKKPYSEHISRPGWIVVQNGTDAGSIPGGIPLAHEDVLDMVPGLQLNEKDVVSFDSGPAWVKASECLEAVKRAAVEQGVIIRYGRATGFRKTRDTWAVDLQGGESVAATRVLFAMGHQTLDFLKGSGVELDISFQRTGAVVIGLDVSGLTEEEAQVYKKMPILQFLGKGEILPSKDEVIKINSAITFHDPGKEIRDQPPTPMSPFFEETKQFAIDVLPGIKNCPIAFRRYCYDAVTKHQDFLISEIPGYPGAYIATGGSFHAWKFLPILGKYIVQLIDGTLADEKKERWKINGTPSAKPVHGDVVPKRAFT